jgi:hypothetical protein
MGKAPKPPGKKMVDIREQTVYNPNNQYDKLV